MGVLGIDDGLRINDGEITPDSSSLLIFFMKPEGLQRCVIININLLPHGFEPEEKVKAKWYALLVDLLTRKMEGCIKFSPSELAEENAWYHRLGALDIIKRRDLNQLSMDAVSIAFDTCKQKQRDQRFAFGLVLLKLISVKDIRMLLVQYLITIQDTTLCMRREETYAFLGRRHPFKLN